MSQNSSILLLRFEDARLEQDCAAMLSCLCSGETREAALLAEQTGIDISAVWNQSWFNQSVLQQPGYIRVDYNSPNHDLLPLDALKQFFDGGLTAAVIEIFHDQAGEFSRYYFLKGSLVEREILLKAHPVLIEAAQSSFHCAEGELTEDRFAKPMPIEQLIKEQQKGAADAQELLDAMTELANLSKSAGVPPGAVIESVLVGRAIKRGLLFALGFGVVTTLLFQGFWLWLTLACILAIVLPVYFVSRIETEFGIQHDDPDKTDQEGDAR